MSRYSYQAHVVAIQLGCVVAHIVDGLLSGILSSGCIANDLSNFSARPRWVRRPDLNVIVRPTLAPSDQKNEN